MTYQEFKDYLSTFLWKENDQVLKTNMDAIIKMGDAYLNRKLQVSEQEKSVILNVTTLDPALPDDYDSIRSVADTDQKIGEFNYTDPADIIVRRDRYRNNAWQPFYSIEGNKLLLIGPAPNPINLYVAYYSVVPDYQTTDTSWLADKYLDLYVYTVLRHASAFLREDERLQGWVQLSDQAITDANEDSLFDSARGQAQAMPLPRRAGSPRRNGRTARFNLHVTPT